MERNVSSQYLTLFAFDYSTGAPKTGDQANLTPYVSVDDGSVTVLTNAGATQLDATNAPGMYKWLLTSGETNGTKLIFTCKSSTANVSIVPQVIYTDPPNFSLMKLDTSLALGYATVYAENHTGEHLLTNTYYDSYTRLTSGTVAAGAAGTVTLAAGASSVDDFYKGRSISIISGTGVGQSRVCTAYNGTTKVATISPNWATNPSAGATYYIGLLDASSVPQTGDSFARLTGTGAVTFATLDVTGATTLSGAVTASNASNDVRGIRVSSGTGTGQLDVTSGRIKADTVYFGGSAGSFTTGVPSVNTTLIAGSLVSTSSAQIGVNVVNAGGTAWGSGAITAASIANGAIDAATFAADVDAEILSYLVDDATRIDASALNTATVTTIPAILLDTAEIGTAGAGLTAVSTGRTFKRIAPGGGGDYTSLSAAITALASTAGIIELVCSAGNIGGGNLHSLTSASEVILRSDLQARHRHDTAQPLSETAYFASNLVFNPTGSGGPAKLRIEGMRSSGVSTGFTVTMTAPSKTYDVELIDNLFANSGGVGSSLDQIYCYVEDGTLNVLAVGNTHFTTTTGSAKGYQVYSAATADGADAARINVRTYNNTGHTDNSAKVIDGIAFAAEDVGGGTAVIYADCRNNLVLGVAQSGTSGAINIQDTGGGVTTLTGSHNASNDSSASANGLTSGLTSAVAADVLSSPTTSNIQLSTATTRDAGYSLPQETLGRRVKSGSVWDIGSHEFQAGLSATQLADIYHADIYYTRDDAGSEDLYKAVWFKNGVRITSGITSPTIQVVKEADGSNLIASTAMTEIGTTEAFKYTATTTARQTAGESCLVIVGATIDGSARTFIRSLGRDSTA